MAPQLKLGHSLLLVFLLLISTTSMAAPTDAMLRKHKGQIRFSFMCFSKSRVNYRLDVLEGKAIILLTSIFNNSEVESFEAEYENVNLGPKGEKLYEHKLSTLNKANYSLVHKQNITQAWVNTRIIHLGIPDRGDLHLVVKLQDGSTTTADCLPQPLNR